MNRKTIGFAALVAFGLSAGMAGAASHGMSGNAGSSMGSNAASNMGSSAGPMADAGKEAKDRMGQDMENGMENNMSEGKGMNGRMVVTGKFRDQIYLMDNNMMTLYTFANDKRGVSNCNGECAEKWPPMLGQPGMDLPRGYSLIQREDGTWQIAYKKMPLYHWMNDANPGDMTGDGVKGVWSVARP